MEIEPKNVTIVPPPEPERKMEVTPEKPQKSTKKL